MITLLFVLVTAGLLYIAEGCLQRLQYFLCRAFVITALVTTALAVTVWVYA